MTKTFVKGCTGFGDSIYLRAIVEWLVENRPGTEYVVASRFPDVFFGIDNIDIVDQIKGEPTVINCSYLDRKDYGDTNQFQDMCINGGLPYVPFVSKLKYRDPNGSVLALPLYAPMGGSPESSPMMPFFGDYDDLLRKHKNVLQIRSEHSFENLVRLFNQAELVICQQGWGTALAEMLDVPCKVVFTERGLKSKNKFIKSICPKKILTKDSSKAVILP